MISKHEQRIHAILVPTCHDLVKETISLIGVMFVAIGVACLT